MKWQIVWFYKVPKCNLFGKSLHLGGFLDKNDLDLSFWWCKIDDLYPIKKLNIMHVYVYMHVMQCNVLWRNDYKAWANLVLLDVRKWLNRIVLQILDHIFSSGIIHVNLRTTTSIFSSNLPHFWKRLLICLDASCYPKIWVMQISRVLLLSF